MKRSRYTQVLIALLPLASMICVVAASAGEDSARWQFDGERAFQSQHGSLVPGKKVGRDKPGPRPPEFPGFAPTNTAVKLEGNGARLVLDDSGESSFFDFTNGDAITLEAWVKVDSIGDGEVMYVIGKGRTGAAQFARDNQNWALRVSESKGLCRVNFLFATTPGVGVGHWHRWTSMAGFKADTGWHHIAAAYRFGDPASIRGWIDGLPSTGTWDLGGPTKEPPIADDDAIWIGSSQGGTPSNSFRGLLDNIAVHRQLLSDEVIASRFSRIGGPRVVVAAPEAMPTLDIPKGRVLMTLAEGLPSRDRWFNEGETWPSETTQWLADEFLLPRIPIRYDEWGIRDSWKAPVLLRMAADVRLPPGKHRFLLRARALSRLWVDGVAIARTDAVTYVPPNGEEPVTPLAEPPSPGLRVAGYHQQEVFGEGMVGPDGRCRVVLEAIVGGKDRRTEIGEVCVAVESPGSETFMILQSVGAGNEALPLTDTAVDAAISRIELSLERHDNRTRRYAAASQDTFWKMRHDVARAFALGKAPPSPKSADHPIDAFIRTKIDRVLAEAAATDTKKVKRFHDDVLPILREQCFRCHGEKQKGGLVLDSRDSAFGGGDSGPAIVPGDAAASELIARVTSEDESLRMPPGGGRLGKDQIAALEQWIETGAEWPPLPVTAEDVRVPPIIDDEAFLRRVHFDTVGVPPTPDEVRGFLDLKEVDKRERVIDALLDDERCADHWVSYWLDLLAENPTLLNASLNSTGPFRWFLYDSLRDNKPLDRLVTELILMRGSPHEGGSAGFAMAAEKDAPFAAKGHIVASAFLGVELQCARCHDPPYHSTTQQDLYALAAMFERKPVTVPGTSNVPAGFFESKRGESLIEVTLKPGEAIAPSWRFAHMTGVVDDPTIDVLMQDPTDSRERLATLITAPQNTRFAEVMVNRIWKRLMGAGIVEPMHDWEGRDASHADLLKWLAYQFITHDYDTRHVMRLILRSQTYQRAAWGRNLLASPQRRLFNAPERRRLSAEQIVDSLHVAAGIPMNVEELTFVHDGRRAVSNRLSLGKPTRAWMLASLNNERDRPSLALPQAQAVVDVLTAFGWSGSRQKPRTDRDADANVLQPGVLANGTLSVTLTRAAQDTSLAQLAVEASSPEELVDTVFLHFLSRYPKRGERQSYAKALAKGFEARVIPSDEIASPDKRPPLPLVTWFNHLQSEANTIQLEVERRVRLGPPPDPRLRANWREIYEDVIWSLVNTSEFVWMP
jgi:mono/diheme cytochrome c family protein